MCNDRDVTPIEQMSIYELRKVVKDCYTALESWMGAIACVTAQYGTEKQLTIRPDVAQYFDGANVELQMEHLENGGLKISYTEKD